MVDVFAERYDGSLKEVAVEIQKDSNIVATQVWSWNEGPTLNLDTPTIFNVMLR